MDVHPEQERLVEVPNPTALPRIDVVLFGLLFGAAAAVVAMSSGASLTCVQCFVAVGLPAALLFVVVGLTILRRQRTRLRRVGDQVLGTRAARRS